MSHVPAAAPRSGMMEPFFKAMGSTGTAAQSAKTSTVPQTRGKEDILKGILCMIAASLFFALTSALAKWQVALYPVGEVMFFRSAFTLVLVAGVMLPRTGFSVYATRMPGAHVARGVSQAISQTFTVLAFSLMPLAGAIAINFSAPLWATILSLVLLRERPGFARWAVLILGFAGVVVVAAPNSSTLQLGAVFALANAVMYGSVTVAVRRMTATESANGLLIWQVTIVAVLQSLLLAFGFKVPTTTDLLLFGLSGLTNALAQYGWTKALSYAPTAAVSPFYYFTLLWAVAIGYVVWNDVPTTALLVGSGIIVCSGLFLLFYEARKRRVLA